MKARKSNVIIKITDEEVKRYYNLGYDIYDNNDKLVKKAIPSDLGELKLAYAQNLEKVAKLEAEVASLKEDLAKAKSASKKAAKVTVTE